MAAHEEASRLLTAVVDDLEAETRDALAVLDRLGSGDWDAATPATGWVVRDQVSHLAWFDDAARLALTDPDRFRANAEADMARGPDFPDRMVADLRRLPPDELTGWFRGSRAELLTEFRRTDPGRKVPWYGPPMSPASAATARLMETWAHFQDIVDAFGWERAPTARLRHIAHIGVRTRGFSFAVRGRPSPGEPVRVELTGPDGEEWAWGPPDAADLVRGPALDFCLLVTQRRHRDDTALVVRGPVADAWMSIAQAFAGPPGPGREPNPGTGP